MTAPDDTREGVEGLAASLIEDCETLREVLGIPGGDEATLVQAAAMLRRLYARAEAAEAEAAALHRQFAEAKAREERLRKAALRLNALAATAMCVMPPDMKATRQLLEESVLKVAALTDPLATLPHTDAAGRHERQDAALTELARLGQEYDAACDARDWFSADIIAKDMAALKPAAGQPTGEEG